MNKIKKFVDSNLAERLRHVDNLSREVYIALSLSLENHNIWAVSNMQTLTLLTDDNILATRLRLEQQKIMQHFKQKLNIAVNTISIKMVMPASLPPKKEKLSSKIAAHSAQSMISIAQEIEDKELKQQIIRMAKQNNNA